MSQETKQKLCWKPIFIVISLAKQSNWMQHLKVQLLIQYQYNQVCSNLKLAALVLSYHEENTCRFKT